MHFGSARQMQNVIQVPFVGLRCARNTVYIPSAFHWTHTCNWKLENITIREYLISLLTSNLAVNYDLKIE